MTKPGKKNDDQQPIIVIKRIKKVESAHHGGAWKVAYADFVTAMMAFFLLLWLLGITTIEDKRQIAAYFSSFDPRPAQDQSGAGGVMGGTVISPQGAMSMTHPTAPEDTPPEEVQAAEQQDPEAAAMAELDREDERNFRGAEEEIRQAIESVPALKNIAKNLLIDLTPEGLRIQLVDQGGKSMFRLGNATPLPHTSALLKIVAGVVKDMPNKVSVRGHTDAIPYGRDASYGNWELSADRANASRRMLEEGGIKPSQLENVQGKADSDPLDAANPTAEINRRITIMILKQSIVRTARKAEDDFKHRQPASSRPAPRQREQGVIYFP